MPAAQKVGISGLWGWVFWKTTITHSISFQFCRKLTKHILYHIANFDGGTQCVIWGVICIWWKVPAAGLVVYQADVSSSKLSVGISHLLCRFQSFYHFYLCEINRAKITISDMLCDSLLVFSAITPGWSIYSQYGFSWDSLGMDKWSHPTLFWAHNTYSCWD